MIERVFESLSIECCYQTFEGVRAQQMARPRHIKGNMPRVSEMEYLVGSRISLCRSTGFACSSEKHGVRARG